MNRVVFILVLFVQSTLFAQGYTVIYEKELRPDVGNQLNEITDPILKKQIQAQLIKTELHELLYKDGVSSFAKKRESNEGKKEGALDLEGATKKQSVKMIRMGSDEISILYKNPENNLYLKSANILGKDFLIKDDLASYKWEITEETKLIGSYICKKATTIVNEKIITAWFTPSIPISDGPDEYHGLPGLIIQLIEDEATYNALSVQETSGVVITKPSKGKEITKEDFEKLKQEQIEAIKQQFGGN